MRNNFVAFALFSRRNAPLKSFDKFRIRSDVLSWPPTSKFLHMKASTVLFLTGLAVSAAAQQQQNDDLLEFKGARRSVESQQAIREQKPNEITTVRLTYSGIIVQVVKTKNPLQLINPFAPAEYGLAEDNVFRDPIDRKITGWKFFSIDF
jgi:hypothetical protein